LRKFVILVVCLMFAMSFKLGCSNTQNGEKTAGDAAGECSYHETCWKKLCNSDSPIEQEECLNKYFTPEDKKGPKYQVCENNKCTVLDRANMGGGKINVILPQGAGNNMKYAMVLIFDKVDLKGKPITCDRLTKTNFPDATLGRFFPQRNLTSVYAVPIIRSGNSLPMLIGGSSQEPIIPAGKDRIVVVHGFCEPKDEEGAPKLETKPRWRSCHTGIEIKKGDNEIDINMKNITPTDKCL